MKKLSTCVVLLLAPLLMPLGAQLTRDAAIAKAEAILKNLQDGNTALSSGNWTGGWPKTLQKRSSNPCGRS
jgi:hypothetical protein